MAPISPYYVAFDENGTFVDRPGFDAALASAAAGGGATDVFVFSHGWQNNFADASQAYTAVIAQMTAVADATAGLRPDPFRPLALGVVWPSKAWDESAGEALEGVGGSAAGPNTSSLAEVVYDNLSPQRASPAGFRH